MKLAGMYISHASRWRSLHDITNSAHAKVLYIAIHIVGRLIHYGNMHAQRRPVLDHSALPCAESNSLSASEVVCREARPSSRDDACPPRSLPRICTLPALQRVDVRQLYVDDC